MLSLNGHAFAAPHTEAVIKGSSNSVMAPLTGPGGRAFVRWSDGGARTHVVKPAANTTLTATYQ
jgi:hypothetical protein